MRNALLIIVTVIMMLNSGLLWSQQAPETEIEKNTAPKDNQFQFNINYWRADCKGTIQLQDSYLYGGRVRVIGEKLDMEEFGLNTPQYIPQIEAQLKLNNHVIAFSFYTADYSGEEYLTANIEFAGYIFKADSILDSTYEINHFKLVYSYSPFTSRIGSIGIMGGWNFYNLHLGYKGTELDYNQSIEEDETYYLPIPVIGLCGNVNLPFNFGLFGQFSLFKFSFSDVEITYADLDAGLRWNYEWFQIGLGYRLLYSYLDLVRNDRSMEINIKHHGLYISAGVCVDF